MTQTDTGNAWRVVLPAGTTIVLPDDATAAQVRAVAVNEATETGTLALTLTAALQLVSPAYMAERNADEKRYALRIATLEEQLKSAASK